MNKLLTFRQSCCIFNTTCAIIIETDASGLADEFRRIYEEHRAQDKQKLAEVMEQAHKEGKQPFDLNEYLNHYHGGVMGSHTKPEDISETVLLSLQCEYYLLHPEMRSTRDLAALHNWMEWLT